MAPKRRASSTPNRTTVAPKRSMRARPTPKWLTGREDLDQVAQRRCLMMLSVLSGEKPVTSVIEELAISRGTYYQLETKALVAMLAALAPGTDGAQSSDAASQSHRIADLEKKVAHLEQDKRRLERLLYLTRKVLPKGPVTVAPGRPRRHTRATPPSSTSAGRRPSPSSPRKAPSPSPGEGLIPKADGATMP